MADRASQYMGIGAPLPSSLRPNQSARYGGQYMAAEHNGYDPNGLCVVFDSLLADGKTADLAQVGKDYPCHLPGEGFHDWPLEVRGQLAYVECVKLTTKTGAVLRCSKTTPFNFTDADADLKDGQWAYAPDMRGEMVYLRTPIGDVEDEVISVEDIGLQWVVPLSFGGRSFAAGDTPDCLIYSHNIRKDNVANVTGQVYGFGDTGMSGSRQLSGALDQSHAAYNSYNPSNPYSGLGGYLGSGSYDGMGAGLAAAGYPSQSPTAGWYTQPQPSMQTPMQTPMQPGGSSGGWYPPQPNAPTPPPHLNFGQRLTEGILPGRQFDRRTGDFNGLWSVLRGVGQLGTGIPIATGWDLINRTGQRTP